MKSILLAFILLSTTSIMAEEVSNTPATTIAVKTEGQTLDEVINKSLATVVDKIKETKGKVAVMDFPGLDGTSTGLSAYIANKAGNKLIEVGRQVVDRSTLEKVISEQKLQQNSLMDAATAAKVGKLAGAGVFIIGNYTKTDTRFVLTIRALSVELGQFIPGAVAEETVKPISKEFQDDLNEFLKIGVNAPVAISLGDKSIVQEVESVPVVDPLFEKKEIEFDTKICKTITSGFPVSKMYTTALKLKYLSVEDLKDNLAMDYKDLTGEQKTNTYQIGNWIIYADGNWMNNDIGELIKGKAINHKVTAWVYTGTHKIPGLEKCSPNIGWWTEARDK